MGDSIKRKSSSAIISIILFFFSIVIFALFLLKNTVDLNGAIQFQEIINVAKVYFTTLDFSSFITYISLMIYIFPIVGSFLGLFGKLSRFCNVVSLLTFFASGVSFLIISLGNVFDFSSIVLIFDSTCFIICLLSILLAFINVEKSK